MKDHLPSFATKRTVVWGGPLPLHFWVKLTRWSEIAYFQSIFARSASAVKPSEKSWINTNRKSTIRAFQWA